jgi:hypothetical protein
MPTAIEPRLVEGPGAGLVRNVDPRHVPDQAWSNGRNIRFPSGGARVKSTDGYQRIEAFQPPVPVVVVWWYVPLIGHPTLVTITTEGAWAGLGAERDALMTYETPRTVDTIVTVDQYKEHLIWADGQHVWTWPGTGAVVPLAGAPVGHIVEIHKEHVLVANLTSPLVQPWRVAFSTLENPFDWTSDSAGDRDFAEDATPITAAKVLGDHVIIHKPNRLARMIFVGPPEQYLVEGIPADDGALTARAAISIGSYQFYMGRTNFYRLAAFSEAIGDRIWPEVQASIDWPRAHLTYAYRRLEWDEVAWKIPTRGAAQPDLTVIFNFRDQTWSLTDHDPGLCFAEVPTEAVPVPSLTPSAVTGVFGTVDGQVHAYGGPNAAGTSIHAWVESRHFTDGLTPAKILAVPCFATGTGTLQVSLRAAMDPRQPMPAWPPAQPLALAPVQTRPWVDVRQYGRLWQIRFETQNLEDSWEIPAYGAAVIPGGYAR